MNGKMLKNPRNSSTEGGDHIYMHYMGCSCCNSKKTRRKSKKKAKQQEKRAWKKDQSL